MKMIMIKSNWKDDALCKGLPTALFFPSNTENRHDMEMAKTICRECPVRRECLTTYLYEEYGIWGGTNERQRRKLRRQIEKKRSLRDIA